MPEEVTTPEHVSLSLQQQPGKWVDYPNDVTQYVAYLRTHIRSQEETLRAREIYAENITNEQNSHLREALNTKIALTGQITELHHQLVDVQERLVNALANPPIQPQPVLLSAQGNTTAGLSSETVRKTGNSTSTKEHRSDKIPDPPMFDGNKTKLREFVTKLRLKMIGNADRYPTTQEKLVYAANRLEGTAMDQVMPYITVDAAKKTKTELEGYENLIQILENAFGDPNKKNHRAEKFYDFTPTRSPFSQILGGIPEICTRNRL